MAAEHFINRKDALAFQGGGQSTAAMAAFAKHFSIRVTLVGLTVCLHPWMSTTPFAVRFFRLNSPRSRAKYRLDVSRAASTDARSARHKR
jgi:hypothetical protein